MEKNNSIKRATSNLSGEENKKKIKAFRSKIYARLDKSRNAFNNHGIKDNKNIYAKGLKNDKTKSR